MVTTKVIRLMTGDVMYHRKKQPNQIIPCNVIHMSIVSKQSTYTFHFTQQRFPSNHQHNKTNGMVMYYFDTSHCDRATDRIYCSVLCVINACRNNHYEPIRCLKTIVKLTNLPNGVCALEVLNKQFANHNDCTRYTTL